MAGTICPALFLLAAMAAPGGVMAKPDPEKWLAGAEAAYAGVASYTAIFHKQQRVAGELTFSERGEEDVYGRSTQILEVVLPRDKAKDYDGTRFVINQDLASKILLWIRVYDRDGQLVENYGYENLDLEAPLSDADFDPKKPAYHF